MDLVFELIHHPDVLVYAMIPVISAVIGCATNALGIQMMFKPLNFIGIKPIFGWQGIVPARARKFAKLQMDQVDTLVDIDEILDRINADEVSQILQPNVRTLIEDILDDVERRQTLYYWENLPEFVKRNVCASVSRELPGGIKDLMDDIKQHHHQLLDAKEIVVEKLDKDKHILVELIQRTISTELNFLIKSGLILGFLFGILQMLMFFKLPDYWLVLPIGGFLVGYLTNWIAVKLMLWPLDAIKIGPFVLQGVFIKRKNEVAMDYAEVLTKQVLNAQTLADHIMRADIDSPMNKLLRYHIKAIIDRSIGNRKYLVILSLGTQKYIHLRSQMIDSMYGNELPVQVQSSIEYTESKIDLADIIETRMKAFTPIELEGFVKPVFEQDEWILYFVGGALGFIAGWAQLVTMFSF